MTEEEVWIQKIKAGQTQYFTDLYDRYKGRLFSLSYRFTGNHGDAEEQLQEVFMRLLAKIDQFRGEASFATWAHRLAVNHLLNFSRREKSRGAHYVESPDREQGARSDNPDLALCLRQAIGELPHGFRKVFILHDQEGFKHEEIGQILGCSPATSRSQLSRARLSLREKLQGLLAKVQENAA